jgi:GxxExxY protein
MKKENELATKIIGCAIEVHKALGPGLLESVYEECLCKELSINKIKYKQQVNIPVLYKGIHIDCGYRIDIVADNCVIIELKAINELLPIHQAQVLTYLKLTKMKLGLLINFNVLLLKDGINRIVNKL